MDILGPRRVQYLSKASPWLVAGKTGRRSGTGIVPTALKHKKRVNFVNGMYTSRIRADNIKEVDSHDVAGTALESKGVAVRPRGGCPRHILTSRGTNTSGTACRRGLSCNQRKQK